MKENLLQILQIIGQIGGLLALLVTPYLYFENRKIRRLSARKNKQIAQNELEKLERNEEIIFHENITVLNCMPFEEDFNPEIQKRGMRDETQRRENYFNDAAKLESIIEEQKEIENMMTFRGLFGLKPKPILLGVKQNSLIRILKKIETLIKDVVSV